MVFLQFAQVLPQHLVFDFVVVGIGSDNPLGLVACHLHDETISGYVGNLKVKSHAALLGAFKVARTTQFQVGLGNAEAIAC